MSASDVSGAMSLTSFLDLSITSKSEHCFIVHISLILSASSVNDVPSYGLSTGMETAYIGEGGDKWYRRRIVIRL